MMNMKIGILQTGYVARPLAEKHGQYPAMFEHLLDGHGLSFEKFVIVENQFPQSTDACDGWLITGSAHSTYEARDYIAPLEEFIRNAYAGGVPIAGICFGHQIMAQALGGEVEKFSGGWRIGPTDYTIGGKNCNLIAMHQDQVVKKPDDATVIAESDFCANAGFIYKGRAISFQSHPEFTAQFTRDLIELNSAKLFSKEIADTAIAALKDEDDSSKIAIQLAAFFISSARKTVS